MRATFLSLVASLAVLGTSVGLAQAVDRHERVTIKPIKKGSEVVGLRVEMTLRPELYTHARVGIAPAKKYQQGTSNKTFRNAASDPKVGHLLHQFKEVRVEKYKPKPVILEVLYKDQPNLKPGDKIEIVTAFSGTGKISDYWHVYGMTSNLMERPQRYALPGSASAAAKPAATKPATTKPAAAKPTAASVRARARSASTATSSARRAPAKKPAAAKPKKPATTRARAR